DERRKIRLAGKVGESVSAESAGVANVDHRRGAEICLRAPRARFRGSRSFCARPPDRMGEPRGAGSQASDCEPLRARDRARDSVAGAARKDSSVRFDAARIHARERGAFTHPENPPACRRSKLPRPGRRNVPPPRSRFPTGAGPGRTVAASCASPRLTSGERQLTNRLAPRNYHHDGVGSRSLQSPDGASSSIRVPLSVAKQERYETSHYVPSENLGENLDASWCPVL